MERLVSNLAIGQKASAARLPGQHRLCPPHRGQCHLATLLFMDSFGEGHFSLFALKGKYEKAG